MSRHDAVVSSAVRLGSRSSLNGSGAIAPSSIGCLICS